MLVQRAVRRLAGLFHLLNLPLISLDGVSKRSYQPLDGFLASLKVSFRLRLKGLEGASGELDEGLVVALEGFSRKRVEGVG